MLRNELVFEKLLEPSYVAEMSRKYPGAITSPLPVEGDVRRLMTVLDVGGWHFLVLVSNVFLSHILISL